MSKTFQGVYELFFRDPKQTAPRSLGYLFLEDSREKVQFVYKQKRYEIISRSGVGPGAFVVIKEVQPT